MKKIISIMLSVLMVLSALSVCVISASADETVEGNWEVMLGVEDENALANGDDIYMSTPGYEYTDNGLEIIPPVYTNSQARFTAISKTKYDSSNFSIKIMVDEFDTTGDCWISFSFWSEKHGLAQGGNQDGTYGYGWSSLLRDNKNYASKDGLFSLFEGFSCGTKSRPGGWNQLSQDEFDTRNDTFIDGKQVIELKVVDNLIYINGVAVPGANNSALYNAFRQDQYLAYFGISVKSGVADAPVKFTILEVNGVKPTGDDRQEPINRAKEFAPIKDKSEIPANTPGVLFDATLRAQNSKLPITSQCLVEITPDLTFEVKSSTTMSCVTFEVNNDYSVDIKDFPYVAIVVKNLCTCPRVDGVPLADTCQGYEGTGLFYFAGDVLGADTDHMVSMRSDRMVDISPEGSDDYYTLIYAELSVTEFEGKDSRIHGVRFDIPGLNTEYSYEIIYLGFFGSYQDMVGYTVNREEGFQLSIEDIGYADFGGVDDEITEFCPECDSELDVDGFCPVCDAVEGVTTAKKPTSSSNNNTSSGCGSVVGMGAIAVIVTAAVTGLITFKKRKED